jgi:threonine synthase
VNYTSSRGDGRIVSGAEAIRSGIAADGGLFVPMELPRLDLGRILKLNTYAELSSFILASLLPDYSCQELNDCAELAYAEKKFDSPAVVPLISVGSRQVLELWHGPTSAFKDMALQIMPMLLSLALQKTEESSDMLILVATSGDTGKAALEGFRDIPRTQILVFYPSEGVSEVQRRQMVTQEGNNVGVIAVEGNFDDAQTGVKKIFASSAMRNLLEQKHLKLSSANSINWGRLAPQIAYYFSAYQSLCVNGRIDAGQQVNFCVPTGNFGNILAGYYAKLMGLPIGRLICASNDNNVLTDFLRTGIYDRNRPFHQTISPSMDILISSNLERLLYHTTNGDTAQVKKWMDELASQGRYQVDAKTFAEIQATFRADWATEAEALNTIRNVWEQHQYLLDPHTAVAWKVAISNESGEKDEIPTVILSTASPFKFADSVLHALREDISWSKTEPLSLLTQLSNLTGWLIPPGLVDLTAKTLKHRSKCRVDTMPEAVAGFIEK